MVAATSFELPPAAIYDHHRRPRCYGILEQRHGIDFNVVPVRQEPVFRFYFCHTEVVATHGLGSTGEWNRLLKVLRMFT